MRLAGGAELFPHMIVLNAQVTVVTVAKGIHDSKPFSALVRYQPNNTQVVTESWLCSGENIQTSHESSFLFMMVHHMEFPSGASCHA